MAAKDAGVKRYFYSSSACVYNQDKQKDENVVALKETDAYPADAEDGYGWEKLFTERMCRHFREDFGLDHPRGPLPQRLRPPRHLGGRPREGPRRPVPQGDPRQGDRQPTTSRSGATASRPGASCISMTASGVDRLMQQRRHRADQHRLQRAGHDQRARRHRRGDRRRQARTATTTSTPPRASTAATATTPSSRSTARLGSGRRKLREGMAKTYAWIYDQYMSKYGAGVTTA